MAKIQYMAFDGELFSEEQECLKYEEDLVAEMKPSIISRWIEEHVVQVVWHDAEVICDPSSLFDHLNATGNALLTQAFLESFVEGLNAENCTYLIEILTPKPTEETVNVE